ncbi:MAG: N-acetylmuramoyl-L-alanine amidase [Ruminococcus sp.]|jgi:N-acetylmuramoyl-L-alanine amidase|nr:N-acetylmuramoyl-L-alanine amidase [Ruminococcus sp.]
MKKSFYKKIFKKTVALTLSLAMTAGILPAAPVFAEDVLTAPEITVIEQQTEVLEDTELAEAPPEEFTPMFTFPEQMRGVFITPETDFPLTNEEGLPLSDDEINAAIDEFFTLSDTFGINTYVLNTSAEKLFYSTDVNITVKKSPIEYVIEAAVARGSFIYLNFSISDLMNTLTDKDFAERLDTFALSVRNFTVKYPTHGIILDGYYSSKNTGTLNDYNNYGSGIGFENFLLDNASYVFSLASSAIRKTNNTVPVGLSVSDVWANYETTSAGSVTTADFEALTDGYADTLSYIEKGYADFLMLKTDGAIGDANKPFKDVTDWWNKAAAAASIPMFVTHSNEKICTDTPGWYSPDELVKQVISASSLSQYKGSAFKSLRALDDNQLDSTTVLMKNYQNEIDVEGLESELEMTLPKSRTFSTEEPEVVFAGSFDPNFPVFYQSQEIKLNEAGRFYFTEDLEVGVNTFKFQSKAKTITYKITRTVKVLKSMTPTEPEIRIDGEGIVSITAIAYKGSEVYAALNGKKIPLKETDGQSEGLDPNSNYAKFMIYYQAPKAKTGEDLDLGQVTVYGIYTAKNGQFKESLVGSQVYVNMLTPQAQAFGGSVLSVKKDNTAVYAANLTGTEPTPTHTRLPAGTLDYYVNTVTYGGTEYYTTNTGRRLRSNAVTVMENFPLGENPIEVINAGTTGGDTFVLLSMSQKIPIDIAYNGVSYRPGDNGQFYVDGFGGDTVSVIFDYITAVNSGDINFPDGSQFKTGRWDTYKASNGLQKTRLTLSLRESGGYYGITSTYDADGNLKLVFNNMSKSLSGMTIIVDPGHGYTGKEEFDPGAVGHIKEQSANLAISKYLTSYLENEGATVIRYKTESETYVTEERAANARQYKPDLFISVHCNAAGKTAYGAEAYYFMPFSMPLAKSISAELSDVLEEVHGGGNSDRGAKYNYFFVTQQQDFPSVLVETGFVTNYDEAMALADKEYQKRFAQAIVKGIKRFIS